MLADARSCAPRPAARGRRPPGDVEAAARRRSPRRAANALGGPHRWEPLLYLAYSRVRSGDGRSRSRGCCSRPAPTRTRGFLWEGLPPPFTALTGAFGRGEGDPPPHRDSLALARLLLEAGADPNDAQAVYNLSWTPGDAWLELLLEFGFGRGDGGPWHARLAPRPPDAARERRGLPDVGGAARLRRTGSRCCWRPASTPTAAARATRSCKGRTALEVALLDGHADSRRALRAAGAREPRARPPPTDRGRLHARRPLRHRAHRRRA